MSNTINSKSSRTSGGIHDDKPVAGEDYEEYDEYDEYEQPEENVGLFSTPARTVSIVISFVMLLGVAVFIAWSLGQQARNGESGNGGVSPVNQGGAVSVISSSIMPSSIYSTVSSSRQARAAKLLGNLVPALQSRDA